jgi:hypothetical protein
MDGAADADRDYADLLSVLVMAQGIVDATRHRALAPLERRRLKQLIDLATELGQELLPEMSTPPPTGTRPGRIQ